MRLSGLSALGKLIVSVYGRFFLELTKPVVPVFHVVPERYSEASVLALTMVGAMALHKYQSINPK